MQKSQLLLPEFIKQWADTHLATKSVTRMQARAASALQSWLF